MTKKKKLSSFVAIMLDLAEKLDLYGRDESQNHVYDDRGTPRVSFMVKDDGILYSRMSVGVATVSLKKDGTVEVDRAPHMQARNLKLHDPDFIDRLVRCLKSCIKNCHRVYLEDRVERCNKEIDQIVGFDNYLQNVLGRTVD
jgi:hypothetical protein